MLRPERALRAPAKIAADGNSAPGVKWQNVPAPGTRVGLLGRDGLTIKRAVPVMTQSPALLPKLENAFRVRVDDETRARLDQVLMRRARAGLRLSMADLAREALLLYLAKEEAKVKPKPVTEAA